MDALIRARPYVIAAFFVALAGVFASPFANTPWLFATAGSIAHVALLLFLATESFGPLARIRGSTSRWAARVFFLLSTVVVAGLVANLVVRVWVS